MQGTQEVAFKFRYVQGGQAKGLRAKKAVVADQALVLAGEPIRFEDIIDTMTRDNRLVLGLVPGVSLGEKTQKALVNGHAIVLEVGGGKAGELKVQVDRITSGMAAERNRQRLEADGRGDRFRAVTCPHCSATIDLSELEVTPLAYCSFCASVITRNLEVVSEGDTHRVCGECGMFDRIRSYTVFYFYFFLIVYGFQYQRRQLCDTCAQKAALRAFWLNLIFILGVPSAVYNFFKARSGRDPRFPELAKANALARKGDYQGADRLFDRLSMASGPHPGVLLNQGLGRLQGGDLPGAAESFSRSLKAASNYWPTQRVLYQLSEAASAGAGQA